MNKSLALLTTLTLLGGCQILPSTAPDQTPPATSAPAAQPAAVPSASFSPDTLYSLLAAELAGQRERYDIALANYMEQAQATGDPAVAERAYRIAEYVGADDAALDAALIWADNAPTNLDAQRIAALQLARAGRQDEAMRYMEQVLNAQGDTHFDFLALTAAQTDPETRTGLRQSFERLLERYPDNAQLLFGRAVLLQQDGRNAEALASLEDHPAGSNEVAPLLLRARLLASLDREEEVLPLLKDGVRRHPDDKRLRLAYARQLLEQNQLEAAREQFAELLRRYPEDDDMRLSLALINLEAKERDEARTQLQTLIERDAHSDTAHFQLGRLAEEENDANAALEQYAAVGPGDEYLPAQVRRTALLVKAGQAAEARRLLASARESQPDVALQLYLIEIESLTNQERLGDAWQVMGEALQRYPDDLNLLYTRAMLAEKRGDLASLERDLRVILGREPNNSMALNALGYTLADRTTRYAEARALIEKAYALNPDDPAILDSLGWVNYRQGNLAAAEELLRRAFKLMPDHEVAAHLGEVLWAAGKQDEAREVWRSALADTPDSAILRGTLKRLTGKVNP
ncbi:tetratricopeptide repeat protein [Pseudomonas sp. GCM10022188]|uniref:tetratricopeptide repeat protein n=1 Tax=Pseudomonas TaxID=286 RepID=UPI001E361AC2|nr:tetratricopeptide repeat protein [Pseudomonas oryzagri]MCC6075933.1 tetratricopeptide repeat protein [Pseudomonas oryzagri]